MKTELTPVAARCQWRGYTIDEIKERRLVNQVKRDLLKEQMLLLYNSIAYRFAGKDQPAEGTSTSGWVKWISMSVTAYRWGQSLASFFRKIRKR